jgi:hypothetical protein
MRELALAKKIFMLLAKANGDVIIFPLAEANGNECGMQRINKSFQTLA